MKHTTQRLEEETLDRVRDFGKMGESFNMVLNKVLDELENLHDRLDSHEDELDELAKDRENEDEPEESEDS